MFCFKIERNLISLMSTFVLVLSFWSSGAAQSKDSRLEDRYPENQYSKLSKQLLTELKEASAQELIDALGHSRFSVRESASRRLYKAGFDNLDLLLEAGLDSDLERRLRANAILAKLARDKTLEQLNTSPKIEVTLSNPRFWSGNNQYIGGLLDQSLDSSLNIKMEPAVERIISPLRISSARTDRDESLGIQTWSYGWSSPGSAQLYLNCPRDYFRSVNVVLRIYCQSRVDDKKEIILSEGQTVVRTDATSVEISRQAQSKDSPAGFVVSILDKLGRLQHQESKVELTADYTLAPRQIGQASRYRRTFLVTDEELGKHKGQASLHVDLKSGPVVYFCEANVVVPRPEQARSE